MASSKFESLKAWVGENEGKIRLWLTVTCGIFLVAHLLSMSNWAVFVATAAGSVHALRASWQSITSRQIDVNVLMILAAGGAAYLMRWGEAAVLLFLFSLSGTLEDYALARTKSAIEGLIKLRPETALRVTHEGNEEVPVAWLKVGDVVRVRPYDGFPVDGTIVNGSTDVDQSAMTGESRAVPKAIGDKVLAGTTNGGGMVLVNVTAAMEETTLEKIVHLVKDAQENKASGEKISQWFGSRYTVFVIIVVCASIGIRAAVGQETDTAIYASLTLLVALSPCAIVISTPASTLSALAWCAKKGILVRGGAFIESIGKVDTVVLDKTGTLTFGKPVLAQICVCDTALTTPSAKQECAERDACWIQGEPMSDESKSILKQAASAEQYSSHPIAEAIVGATRHQGVEVPEADDHQAVPGFGVTALVGSKNVRVGQRRFFEQGGETLPDHFIEHVEDMQGKGMTVAVVESQGEYAALGLEDGPRDEASQVLKELFALGVKRQILATGDTTQTAQSIASQVGITEVHAALLPDEKENLVAELEASGHKVVMVGDGINDAPSLARAHVGIAMGGLGSDVALNAADIVLMKDDLGAVPDLVKLGRKTNAIIKQNLVFGTMVIAALFIASLTWDMFSMQKNLILPLAVVGHEGSTVLVILNGLRLLRGPK